MANARAGLSTGAMIGLTAALAVAFAVGLRGFVGLRAMVVSPWVGGFSGRAI